MNLDAIIDDQIFTLQVPDTLIGEAEAFFSRMDQDMDSGAQLSREWVDHPNRLQRCQIVANKLLTALENENHNLGRLMAGYLLARMPDLQSVEIDTHGEIGETLFHLKGQSPTSPQDPALLQRANEEISQVFKAGKQWKFSLFDHRNGSWSDSDAFAREEEAKERREKAVRLRCQELASAR